MGLYFNYNPMKDEFSNENMLKILISQKKYIEAYRLYKILLNNGTIQEPSIYVELIREVEKIDPVLTMDKETKAKKAEKLVKILNRIRGIKGREHKVVQKIEQNVPLVEEKVISETTEKVKHEPQERKREERLSLTTIDILKTIEGFTAVSISSIMNMISGNFSKDILSRRARSEKIEILQEMLKRIEIIKSHRKKELLNV